MVKGVEEGKREEGRGKYEYYDFPIDSIDLAM